MRRKSKNHFDHGIAAYPTKWRDFLVSQEKICIQFSDLQAKTRINKCHEDQLQKTVGGWQMPIRHDGTDINFLAVGVPIGIHKIMQLELLKAYEDHISKYGNELKDFLIEYRDQLDQLLRRI